jgi:hypothetical protein
MSQPIRKVWGHSTALDLDHCVKIFGECIEDPNSDPRQWPTGELNSSVVLGEIAAHYGANFIGQYDDLVTTYVSTEFEKQFKANYNDLDSFLKAKHSYDNAGMSCSGTKVLAALQQKLQPQSLEACSAEFKKALFIVQIGTIFAAGKARREACSAHQVGHLRDLSFFGDQKC